MSKLDVEVGILMGVTCEKASVTKFYPSEIYCIPKVHCDIWSKCLMSLGVYLSGLVDNASVNYLWSVNTAKCLYSNKCLKFLTATEIVDSSHENVV